MNRKTNLQSNSLPIASSNKIKLSIGYIQYKLPLVFGMTFFIIFSMAMMTLTYWANENRSLLVDEREQILTVTRHIMSVGGVSIVIATILLIIYTHFCITKPIMHIKNRAEAIADGNYDSVDTISPKRNELGLLADSISELALKIKDSSATRESERQRLDSVLAHMSDGVIATDRRGNVILINDAAEVLLDKSKDNMLGESIMDVFGIRDKYSYRQMLETKDELILSIPAEDGQTSIIRGEFSVIKRESGFISGMVCVLSDVTEQEKVEQERRDFVSNVSHELRTPLTSLRSYTETLLDGAWEDSQLAPQFLSVIQSETERMIRMVSDLLNLSRLDNMDVQSMNFEVIDVSNLMERICQRYEIVLQSEEYRHKAYRLQKELPSTPLWIEGDEDRIIQVIDNIMNNAIKYSPDGGKITCRLTEWEQQIVISIADEGLGIPKKAMSHIFKRFYRVDKARSRQQGGTGLGLAIAKEVVELHKGKIWVSSKENLGSIFFVALPKITFENEWV